MSDNDTTMDFDAGETADDFETPVGVEPPDVVPEPTPAVDFERPSPLTDAEAPSLEPDPVDPAALADPAEQSVVQPVVDAPRVDLSDPTTVAPHEVSSSEAPPPPPGSALDAPPGAPTGESTASGNTAPPAPGSSSSGEAPAPPGPFSGEAGGVMGTGQPGSGVDLGETEGGAPMPPVQGDRTDLTPAAPGSSSDTDEIPVAPGAPGAFSGEAGGVMGTGQPGSETGLGQTDGGAPMPPVQGDRTDLTPAAPGSSSGTDEIPVAPGPADGNAGGVMGTGQPGSGSEIGIDLGPGADPPVYFPDLGMYVSHDENGEIRYDPVTELTFRTDEATGVLMTADGSAHIDPETTEIVYGPYLPEHLPDEVPEFPPDDPDVPREVPLTDVVVAPGQEVAQANELTSLFRGAFDEVPADFEQRMAASLIQAAGDGSLTIEDQVQALLDAGLSEDQILAASGPEMRSILDHLEHLNAAEAGGAAGTTTTTTTTSTSNVTTILNLGDGPDGYRVSVKDGVVQLESVQGRGTYVVERSQFEQAFGSNGGRVVSVAPIPGPVPLEATPVAAPIEDDGDGSDFGRNLLIGGAILLPAAGAATYFATRKIR